MSFRRENLRVVAEIAVRKWRGGSAEGGREEVARRFKERDEETGFRLHNLREAGGFHVSPGAIEREQ